MKKVGVTMRQTNARTLDGLKLSWDNLRAEAAREFVRFSLSQRMEHLLLMLSFTTLTITGVPQKFHDAAWADWAIAVMGGIEAVRQIHHLAAAMFILEGLYHAAFVFRSVVQKRQRPAMLPGPKDVRDVIHTLLYYVGFTRTQPRYDRFDFRQKFEYWGLIWGGVVMILTGLVMWFPVQATRLIPGELIPAAKAAHGGEALLALLTIVCWHFYWAHLNQHSMPFDMTIFTGKISERRMIEEHPLEYERLTGKPASELEREGRPAGIG